MESDEEDDQKEDGERNQEVAAPRGEPAHVVFDERGRARAEEALGGVERVCQRKCGADGGLLKAVVEAVVEAVLVAMRREARYAGVASVASTTVRLPRVWHHPDGTTLDGARAGGAPWRECGGIG